MTPPGLYSLRKAERSGVTLVPRNPTMKSCPIFSRDVSSRRATSQAPIDKVLDQQPRADAGRTLGNVGPLSLAPIGASDIVVHPGAIAGDLAQEQGPRDYPAAAAADIAHVRDVAAKLFKIFVPKRHLPYTL